MAAKIPLQSWNAATDAQRALWLLAGITVDLTPTLAALDAYRRARLADDFLVWLAARVA